MVNYVSESSASKMWCPLSKRDTNSDVDSKGKVKIVPTISKLILRGVPSTEYCVGSKCMFWVYENKDKVTGTCGLVCRGE